MENKRVALVTGGMGGLGTALCRRLHQTGFTVAATYSPRNEAPEAWLAAQRDDGFRFSAYRCELSDFGAAETMMRDLLADHGRLDVLVNNAGITRDVTLSRMQETDWHDVLRTNLDSVFNMSRHALAPMLAQRWGRIINIASVNGQKGAVGQANYAAAKAGMHGFTKSAALELARHGITVNTVSPGYLNTGMVRQMPVSILQEKILPQIPVGRLGEPEEVAGLLAYLCSEQAAFITGANLAINGGQHMH